MPNITIDPDILIKAMTAAIQAAIQTSRDEVLPPLAVDTSNTKPKAKKGRPKKTVSGETCKNTEIIKVENEILEVANTKDDFIRKPNQKNSYIYAAKKISNSGSSTKQSAESVLDNRKEQKFIDIDNIPHEKQTWEPTERRPAARLLDFVCTNCHKPFKDYASNVQQAFFKVGGSDMPDSQNGCLVIKCPVCSTK